VATKAVKLCSDMRTIPILTGTNPQFCYVQNGSGAYPVSYPMGTRVSFPGGNAYHSPPSSAEVKNAWSYTSTPPVRLHGVVLS
jgi:hypothetical protein